MPAYFALLYVGQWAEDTAFGTKWCWVQTPTLLLSP